MKAQLLLRERTQLADDRFVETVIWSVPKAVRESSHGFKYHLALVVDEICVLRYDNEAGKGDHKHLGAEEFPYRFTTISQLIADFRGDVLDWRPT